MCHLACKVYVPDPHETEKCSSSCGLGHIRLSVKRMLIHTSIILCIHAVPLSDIHCFQATNDCLIAGVDQYIEKNEKEGYIGIERA